MTYTLPLAAMLLFGEKILPFLFFFLIAGIMVAVIVGSYIYEKKRREAWQKIASDLGFTYAERDDDLHHNFHFKLFQHGRAKSTRNILQGEAAGTSITIGDYRYTTGRGKNSTTHNQSICILTSDTLDLPRIFIRPEHFFDSLGEMLGGQDIDFPDDEAFSSAFVLQGDDEGAVQAALPPEVRQYLLSYKQRGLHLEAQGNQIMIYFSKRIKPDECQEIMEIAYKLMGYWAI